MPTRGLPCAALPLGDDAAGTRSMHGHSRVIATSRARRNRMPEATAPIATARRRLCADPAGGRPLAGRAARARPRQEGHRSCSAWCSSRRASTRPSAPAAAIGEIVHYNIFEGLTKINVDGTVTPLLAESWTPRPRRQELHLQAAQGRQVPGRRAVRRGGGQVQLRARQGPKSTTTRPSRRCSTTSARSARPTRTRSILTLNNADGDLPVPHGREHGRDPAARRARPTPRPSRSAPAPTSSTAGRRARRSRSTSGPAIATPQPIKLKQGDVSASSTTRRPRWRRCWPATSTASRASRTAAA